MATITLSYRDVYCRLSCNFFWYPPMTFHVNVGCKQLTSCGTSLKQTGSKKSSNVLASKLFTQPLFLVRILIGVTEICCSCVYINANRQWMIFVVSYYTVSETKLLASKSRSGDDCFEQMVNLVSETMRFVAIEGIFHLTEVNYQLKQTFPRPMVSRLSGVLVWT